MPKPTPKVVAKSETGEVYPNVEFDSGDSNGRAKVRYQSADPQQDAASVRLRKTFDENESNGKSDRENRVANVFIRGNQLLPTHKITRNLGTRPGRFFDPDQLQQDIEKLWRMPEIRRIKGPFIARTPNGVDVTIEVIERNQVTEVQFVGNRGITDRALKKETGLEDGQPLDIHEIRMAKTKIEDYYKEKGYPKTQVEIVEGTEASDENVVFLIHEDQKQRVWNVEFEGNTFATDARLRHFIKSKPGILKIVGGLVKREEIENDVLRLEGYYKRFGYFNARIGRELSESNDGRWLTLRFIIDEGPRYRIRNVAFMGNQHYPSEELAKLVNLKPAGGGAPEFNVGQMNEDVVSLQELYGSNGFVFAKVEAEPRFLEEPGQLDLVYKIDEGKQYRVGKINVFIEGDHGITRQSVVLKRSSLRPGETFDKGKLDETRQILNRARIFGGSEPGTGPAPRIVIRPRELDDISRTANRQSRAGSGFGGGSGTRNR